MPASPPPSALPSRPSPSRPADASSKFVLSKTGGAEVEGSEASVPVGDSGSVAEKSVESGDGSGAHDGIGANAPSAGEGDADATPSSNAGDAEASSEFGSQSVELPPAPQMPPATVHSVSNPLPELELVSQVADKEGMAPTVSERKVGSQLLASMTRVDTAGQQQAELGLNPAQQGAVVGSSSEGMLDLDSAPPTELDSKTTKPSDLSASLERVDGPRPQDVNITGRGQEHSAGDGRQFSSRSAASRTKVLTGDLPEADQSVAQIESDSTRPTRAERPEVHGARLSLAAKDGEVSKSPTRNEWASAASASFESSLPAREVAGEPVQAVPQGVASQPTKVNSSAQSMNFSGGLAEVVDPGAAEEVPASVNLTRRALRSLGRGHGGATVVQLRPAQFGKVTVRVQLEEGRVQADLVARTPEAARVLGEHLRLLRDSLEQKGLVVDRLEVREESKVESSRLDQHNEKDADEDQSGGERDRRDGDASSGQSSPQMRGQAGDLADEFGQVLMAAEEQV